MAPRHWDASAARYGALPNGAAKTLRIPNHHVAVCQNLVPLVNIKIAGKWMFIPLKWY
jgi:hypothetical protein